jgi:hypothetical protein
VATLLGETYRGITENSSNPPAEERNVQNAWLREDGATCNTAKASKTSDFHGDEDSSRDLLGCDAV